MKKVFASLALMLVLSSCGGSSFSANLSNPFGSNEEGRTEILITLSNGERVNIDSSIDQLLQGQSVNLNGYSLEAKILVEDINTSATQLIQFPKIERVQQKNTDIFDIPEELVYTDENTGLIWEIDATQSGLMTYLEAKEYCRNFGEISYGKAFDIPSVEELKTILKGNQAGIDTDTFKNLPDTYWTKHKFAYSFYYKDGVLVDKDRGLAYARCVGQKN